MARPGGRLAAEFIDSAAGVAPADRAAVNLAVAAPGWARVASARRQLHIKVRKGTRVRQPRPC